MDDRRLDFDQARGRDRLDLMRNVGSLGTDAIRGARARRKFAVLDAEGGGAGAGEVE